MLPPAGSTTRTLVAVTAGISLGPIGFALAPYLVELLPESLQKTGDTLLASGIDALKRVGPRVAYEELKAALKKPPSSRPYEALFHEALRSVLTDLCTRPEYEDYRKAWLDVWIRQLEQPLPLSEADIDALIGLHQDTAESPAPGAWALVAAVLADSHAAQGRAPLSIVLRPVELPSDLLRLLNRDLPDRLTAATRQRLFDPEQPGAFRDVVLRSFDGLAAQIAAIAADTRVDLVPLLDRPWNVRGAMPFHFASDEAAALFGPASERLAAHELAPFLEGDGSVRWWLWTGLEGAGKSRLAAFACHLAIGQGWRAGFLPSDQRDALATDPLRPVVVSHDTLLVIDDAGFKPTTVRSLLGRLLARRHGPGRVRVLLLERHAGPLEPSADDVHLPSWYLEIFRSPMGGYDDPALRLAQHPSAGSSSFHVGDFDREQALTFAERCAAAAGAGTDAGGVARRAIDLLTSGQRPPQTRPLHIQLTVHVLVNAGDDGMATFEGVVSRYLAGRLHFRRERLSDALSSPGDVVRAINLMCVATLLGHLPLAQVPEHGDLPTAAIATERAALLGAFDQSPRADALNGVEPDLIGEWFVLLWCSGSPDFTDGLTLDRLEAILDAMPDATEAIADFVQRTFRYFHDQDLWRRLSRRIGRYATPFGRLFDQRTHQLELLRGTASDAAAHYQQSVRAAIDRSFTESGGPVVLVDLMAGGPEFLRSIALGDGAERLLVLAIDRDPTRLAALEREVARDVRRSGTGPRLRVVRATVAGTIGLRHLLAQAFGVETCDVLIARKALHEIPWSAQEALIQEIGETVTPDTGRLVIYADAPDVMDAAGRQRLQKFRLTLGAGTDPDAQSREALITRLAGLRFDAAAPSSAGTFANFWIQLKDWANHNEHEFRHRYFSGANELTETFRAAGFDTDRPDAVRRFTMRLEPTRFIEDAINRLGYLCADGHVPDAELASVVENNVRYEVFRRVVDAILWQDTGATSFGQSVHAEREPPFDLHQLVKGLGDRASRLQDVRFPSWTSTSFEMPIRVFTLARRRA